MKNILFSLISVSAFLHACVSEQPVAGFSFRNEATSDFSMATYDTCTLVNLSEHSESIMWDFGDGRTSHERNVVLSYEKSGSYDVKLTIADNDGHETTVSKKVTIKDRVLRSIEVTKIIWDNSLNTGPPNAAAIVDVFLTIQLFSDTTVTDGFICADCPVLYTSDTVKGVHNYTTTAITIPVTEKVVIDKKKIDFAWPQNLNKTYLITLVAKDNNGELWSLQSNRGGGSYFGILEEDFEKNKFIIQMGPYSDLQLVCDFE